MFFDEIDFIGHAHPVEALSAAVNMAVDEVLLMSALRPLVRVYRWKRAAVSFGYFEAWQEVFLANGLGNEALGEVEMDFVRRWTGGGVVWHGPDFTYSLVVPRGCAFAKVGALESYQAVHECIAALLRADGREAELTPVAPQKVSQACFENPAQYDLTVAGQKVAGAAQRRSRYGLLHQGSIQGVPLAMNFAPRLAHAFAGRVHLRDLTEAERKQAEALAASKYGTEAWLKRF